MCRDEICICLAAADACQSSYNRLVILTPGAGAIFTQVIFASYGNPTGSGPFTVGTCNSSSSVSYVSSQILNKNTYVIYANNTNFGDPCSANNDNAFHRGFTNPRLLPNIDPARYRNERKWPSNTVCKWKGDSGMQERCHGLVDIYL
jgi:hypothetical protein